MTTPTQPMPPSPVRLRLSSSRALLAGFVLALALATTAAVADGTGATPPAAGASQAGTVPPPVRISTASVKLSVSPFTSCWSGDHVGQCIDGIPPSPAPSLGETGRRHMTLSFARDRWHFVVSVVDHDGNRTRVHLVRTGAGHWRLDLSGLANGRYRADVFGRGPQGDVAAVFAFAL